MHISIISVVLPPVSPNKPEICSANNSKIQVNIKVTIAVSIIPYLMQSFILSYLSFHS